MGFFKKIWMKIGISALILAALSFLVLWDSKPKEVLNAAPIAVLADTTTPTSSPSLATPEEPEEELPTIKRSKIPKYPALIGNSGGEDIETVFVYGDTIEEPISLSSSLSYSDEVVPVHFKSDAELEKIVADLSSSMRKADFEIESKILRDQIKENISRSGHIARQYLPDDAVTDYYEVDVDGDGIKEELVTLCGIGGSHHCSGYAQIIKNDKVVFSVKLNGDGAGYGDGITPAKEGGFYVEWTNDASFYDEKGRWVGLCCPVSHNKTLFQFKNGKFIPIKQWKTFHVWKRVIEG